MRHKSTLERNPTTETSSHSLNLQISLNFQITGNLTVLKSYKKVHKLSLITNEYKTSVNGGNFASKYYATVNCHLDIAA